MSLWKPIPVASAITVLLLVSGCSSDPGAPDSSSDSQDAQPFMEHIHGIGVDPKEGAVYAGTHYGLFRIIDGSATRVADRVQDFMGFTVAGPGHFLASGHPGEDQDGPGAVGLISSDDAGQSWQELSLGGEADFHALEYRHDRAYGLNSMTGQLLVSTDLKSWEELTSAPIEDFAVSPADPNVLLATTQKGLVQSSDGGRAFESLASAPLMVFVSWAEDGTLVGVTPEGDLYTAEDPAGEWAQRSNLGGPPEALTVQSSTEIYAAATGAVLVSADGGDSFTPLLTD